MAQYTNNDVKEVISSLNETASLICSKLGADVSFGVDDEDAIFDEAVLQSELEYMLGKIEKFSKTLHNGYCK